MLSNQHDKHTMDINHSNYEEYFLLYVDNELTPGERTAVETFAATAVQLKEELALLSAARLTAEDITIEKEGLLACRMKISMEEESLLLYIDGELTATEEGKMKQQLSTDADLRAQYGLLVKTKFDKADSVPFPHKAALYRTNPAIRPLYYWLRIAVAILLMLSIGLAMWLGDGKAKQSVAVVKTPQKRTETELTVPHKTRVIPASKVEQRIAVQKPNRQVMSGLAVAKKISRRVPIQKEGTGVAAENAVAVNNHPMKTPVVSLNEKEKENPPSSQQIINNVFVTPQTVQTYNPIAATDKDFINTVATTGDKKGRSVRGFLRKATRFIERTTNVNPVNDDNELLIGAVALKLK